MKRTPLLRKTALKRGKSTLKKTKLKKMSKDKAAWTKLYRQAGKPTCGMESHHPMGRIGNRILVYLFIEKSLHRWIHDNGKEARAAHWLLKPFDGKPYDPDEPRAWDKEQEETWPEEYKRPKQL